MRVAVAEIIQHWFVAVAAVDLLGEPNLAGAADLRLPEEAAKERAAYEAAGNRSVVMVPMVYNRETLGVLGIGTILATIEVMLDAQWPQLFLDLFKDVK